MGTSSAGQVVLIGFPFSDLSQVKMRPALVMAVAEQGDAILCQITSNAYGDRRAVEISDDDFERGSLRLKSFARPLKLFTAHDSLIRRRIGMLRSEAHQKVTTALIVHLQSQ